MTAEECIRLIEEGIEEFGRYSYYDKGPSDVIMMDAVQVQFDSMPATEVAAVLREVLKHKHGEPFVGYVVSCSQDRSNEDFEIIHAAYPQW